jgi:hypothetical protein
MAASKIRLLLLDVLVFCFVQPAQALFNSTPQLLARERHALRDLTDTKQALKSSEEAFDRKAEAI